MRDEYRDKPNQERYGGPRTLEKLRVLENCLDAYATALRKQRFGLTYVDAFAGTGYVKPRRRRKRNRSREKDREPYSGAHAAMSSHSSIEWTEVTWNPVTGCTKISDGCKHCYAERMAGRLRAMGVEKYRRGFEVAVHENALMEPLGWKRPRLVFVNSMSDLFHEAVSAKFVESVFDVMNRAREHTF